LIALVVAEAVQSGFAGADIPAAASPYRPLHGGAWIWRRCLNEVAAKGACIARTHIPQATGAITQGASWGGRQACI
jgi:hypothetical protein